MKRHNSKATKLTLGMDNGSRTAMEEVIRPANRWLALPPLKPQKKEV